MRDKFYLVSFLLGAGLLLYAGRGLLQESAVVTWGLTFAGTTAAGVLGMALYRVQLELRASRQELAMRQAELNFALEVQRALFPRQLPTDHGLEFSGVCVPARGISGDYYDVVALPNGRLAFAIADISGKGISAAILMSNLHAVLRTLVAAGCTPVEVGARLNQHLHQVTEGLRFATFFYGEWNPAARCLSYLNAGHNAPFLVSSHRRVQRLDPCGPPLGLFPEFQFGVRECRLEQGDLLALFSDGVTEAGIERDREFGEEQLEKLIASHAGKPLAEIQQQVLTAVTRWAGQEAEDDLTLLLVRVTGENKETP
jgi:sigma-B regulation protein RsbU (phosphoserine phosphatase)